MLRAGLCLLLVLACRAQVLLEGEPPPPAEILDTRELRHPGTESPRRRYGTLTLPGGRTLRHGKAFEWYPDGSPKSERDYVRGEPTGTWRSWFEDGTPESEVHFGDGRTLGAMRWWHPNGQLAGEGETLSGLKEGAWDFWHPNGVRSESGVFRSNRRQGDWTFWDEQGRPEAKGLYAGGVRVGEWRLWDDAGELHLRQEKPLSPDGRQ